jgi:NodT family efflux transporter outer membrane factor (OMF) lipoprotein
VIANVITCSMLLVLSSCAIPNLRHPDPAPDIPPTFDGLNGEENSSQLAIDEFFSDPVLLHLIDDALEGNRELKILNEEAQIAKNEVLARQGAYLPFASLNFTGGLDKPSKFTPLGAAEDQLEYLPGQHFPDPLPNIQPGLSVFWQLDIWRQLRNARDAAQQRYFAASEKRNYFVTRLIADVAENYYHLVALDKRLENLGTMISIQERSLRIAELRRAAARDTVLPVYRFQADVRKNQSETLIVRQEIIQVENQINFLMNRYPQPVPRTSAGFLEMQIHPLSLGVPAQLLENRPDIRQAEHEIEAAGLDVKVARANFFPRVDITADVGYQSFNPRYLFLTPEAMFANVAGNLVVPLINKRAIQAQFCTANARQLQSIYNYQRTILNAFTEVINRMSMVVNYSRSIEIKKEQLKSLQASVDTATSLFQSGRKEYVEVLLAQRDLLDVRMVLIDTKQRQLSAIVNTYQALGGGDLSSYANREAPPEAPAEAAPAPPPAPPPQN